MRVLLDENVDRLLKTLFDAMYEVVTVQERGWAGIKNGALLRAAQQEFDAFVTMDRNLPYQQNLTVLTLAVIVIHAHSNAYTEIAPLMPRVNQALRSAQPGRAIFVGS
jgi:hypothetical protein